MKNSNLRKTLVAGSMVLAMNSFATTNKPKIELLGEETVSKMQTKQIISGKQSAIKRVKATFDYYTDSIYDVYVTPDFQTVLKLDPTEELIDIKNGNSETFNIEQDYGGADNAQYLFITANDLDVTSNIVVMTSKRLYMINLYSTLDVFNPIVEFNYPMKGNSQTYTISQRVQDRKATSTVNPDKFDFNYAITGNAKASFKPTSVYNDGVKTVINFPQGIQETPVVMVKGLDTNTYEVVNTEYEKDKLIIHRVVKEAVLISGKNKVTIKHR